MHKPKLQILLRKHRDVIFEIDMIAGATYTVEADKSDFYNARDKKLVEFKMKQSVSFKNGERLHLWVPRGFRGSLILKSSGSVLGKYEPNGLDATRYDEDASTKPAPLLVAIKKEPKTPDFIKNPNSRTSTHTGIPLKRPALPLCIVASPNKWTTANLSCDPGAVIAKKAGSFPTTVVVDGSDEGMPEKLWEHFKSGGDSSGLVDLDPNDVVTRNWLYGQLAGNAVYAKDNWSWLRNSINKQSDGRFRLVKARAIRVRGKIRIYYSGYAGSNPFFGAGGFSPTNAKVVQSHVGAGSVRGFAKAAGSAVRGTVKGNAVFSLIFGTATVFAEWRSDAVKDGYDLTAALLTMLFKTLLAALATIIVVALVAVVWMIVAGAALAALAVAAVTVVAGIALSYAIDWADKAMGRALDPKNEDGLSEEVAPLLREAGDWIGDQFSYLERMFNANYKFAGAAL